jgi:hypothetical protein
MMLFVIAVPNDVCDVVKVISPSPSSIYIAWKPLDPEKHYGILKGYFVVYLKLNENQANYKEKSVSVKATNCTVTKDVKAYSSYYIGVLGYTSKGYYVTNDMLKRASSVTTMEDSKYML